MRLSLALLYHVINDVMQSKTELVSTLPELSKCTNGISWLQLDIPVLFLDDENTGISVSDVGRRGITMELKLSVFAFILDFILAFNFFAGLESLSAVLPT